MVLLVVAVVGLRLWLSTPPALSTQHNSDATVSEQQTAQRSQVNSSPFSNADESSQGALLDHHQHVAQLLARGNYQDAADHVNTNYSLLTLADLDKLKRAFITVSASTPRPTQRLRIATELFDELDTWQALAQHTLNQQDWRVAHGALFRVSQLESNPSELEKSLQLLVVTSSYLRGEMERNNDQVGIHQLFQDLHDAHPWYARFQLELAHAQAALGKMDAAQQSYQALRFDPEFGPIAETSLDLLKQHQGRPDNTPQISGQKRIPLARLGTSLLIDTAINGRSLPLLLDTGASITALSNTVISQLGLPATGKRIQITTANGQRNALLYFVDTIELGDLRLSNVEIAGIELDSTSSFVGLLGTDALSALNRDFNYVIDQRQSALILNPR